MEEETISAPSRQIAVRWTSVLSELTPVYTEKWLEHSGKRFRTSYAIDLIDHFITQYHIYNKPTVQLNSRWLKKIYGNQYPTVIDWLVDNGIIYLHKNYSTGKKSKQYRLVKRVVDNGFISTTVKPCPKLEEKKSEVREVREAVNAAGIPPEVLMHLRWSLDHITLDHGGAKRVLEGLEMTSSALRINKSHVDKIALGDISSGFDHHGRFHTNFTRLKREVRHTCLRIDDVPVAELDIKNSQPFFLLLVMRGAGFHDDGYSQDVLNGKIYERLSMHSGQDRKSVKTEVFRVLFGRNRVVDPGPVEASFKELYPRVLEWIVEYKRELGKYKLLAPKLQRIESDFIFKMVIPEILAWRVTPIVTIHDSIVFDSRYYEDVRRIWNRCLARVWEI